MNAVDKTLLHVRHQNLKYINSNATGKEHGLSDHDE